MGGRGSKGLARLQACVRREVPESAAPVSPQPPALGSQITKMLIVLPYVPTLVPCTSPSSLRPVLPGPGPLPAYPHTLIPGYSSTCPYASARRVVRTTSTKWRPSTRQAKRASTLCTLIGRRWLASSLVLSGLEITRLSPPQARSRQHPLYYLRLIRAPAPVLYLR